MRQIFSFLSIIFFNVLIAQQSVPLRGTSFKGAVEFLPNSKLSGDFSKIKMNTFDYKDPKLDSKVWYEEDGASMKGFVDDAVLLFEWWTRAGSPSERYKFDWTSSGYFELSYPDGNAIPKFVRISRSDLIKYPNLLERFDNLTPIDLEFGFNFHICGMPDQGKENFKKKYRFFGDLGSAGYSVDYNRKLDADFIIFKPSRRKQEWTTPNLTLGGWDEFLNFQAKHNDKRTALIELFSIGEDMCFGNFYISKIKWRISDFIYIAKKFDDYEKGKDKPSTTDEVAHCESKTKSNDDFGGGTAEMLCAIDLDKNFNNTTTNEGILVIKGKATGPKSLIRSGIVKAEGYQQGFEINEKGEFTTSIVLSAGLNNIEILVCSKSIKQQITLNREPVDLRATLTWNKSGCDLDLYVKDPSGNSCYYKNKSSGNMRLDVDNTSGYGPENVYVTKANKGTYTVNVENFNRGEGAEATIYIFINEKLKDVHKIRFTTGKEFIKVCQYTF